MSDPEHIYIRPEQIERIPPDAQHQAPPPPPTEPGAAVLEHLRQAMPGLAGPLCGDGPLGYALRAIRDRMVAAAQNRAQQPPPAPPPPQHTGPRPSAPPPPTPGPGEPPSGHPPTVGAAAHPPAPTGGRSLGSYLLAALAGAAATGLVVVTANAIYRSGEDRAIREHDRDRRRRRNRKRRNRRRRARRRRQHGRQRA